MYNRNCMRNKDQYNEKKCVEAIRLGDASAYKKLFLTYYDPLCNFSWRFTRSKAISEDLVQDVFVDLWNLRRSLDPQKSISVYLYQAVKNKAIDYVEHQKVVRRYRGSLEHTKKNVMPLQRSIQEERAFVKAARNAWFTNNKKTIRKGLEKVLQK